MLLSLACALLVSGFTSLQQDVTASLADSMMRATKNIVVLDVRTPEEYSLGHIQTKDAVILVYSRTGKRSAEALEILGNLKYSRIHNMLRGFLAWKKEGRPFTKGK